MRLALLVQFFYLLSINLTSFSNSIHLRSLVNHIADFCTICEEGEGCKCIAESRTCDCPIQQFPLSEKPGPHPRPRDSQQKMEQERKNRLQVAKAQSERIHDLALKSVLIAEKVEIAKSTETVLAANPEFRSLPNKLASAMNDLNSVNKLLAKGQIDSKILGDKTNVENPRIAQDSSPYLPPMDLIPPIIKVVPTPPQTAGLKSSSEDSIFDCSIDKYHPSMTDKQAVLCSGRHLDGSHGSIQY